MTGLNVLSPIAGGIPVAGTPLKASIDALLDMLNGINVSQRILEYPPCVIYHSGRQEARNSENAAHLTRRLYRLEAAISAVPPATPSAQYQRDELARYASPSEICSNTLNLGCTFRKLDAVTERLRRLRINNILGSADIAQAILNCIR